MTSTSVSQHHSPSDVAVLTPTPKTQSTLLAFLKNWLEVFFTGLDSSHFKSMSLFRNLALGIIKIHSNA